MAFISLNCGRQGCLALFIGLLGLLSVGRPVAGQALYSYSDDFQTDKAETDSILHSRFWPSGVNPPDEPFLVYSDDGSSRSLLLMGRLDEPAEIVYRLPVERAACTRADYGQVTVDVEFLGSDLFLPKFNRRLRYSLSTDGLHWSLPTVLPEGVQVIDLEGIVCNTFIRFAGTKAILKNFQVQLFRSEPDIRVPADFPAIQDAIDAALPGAIIDVAAGTYSGAGNWDLQLHGKPLTLRGAIGTEETIIDCTDISGTPHRGFYLHEGEGPDTIVRDLIVRNGRAADGTVPAAELPWPNSEGHPIGGGVFCENSSPTFMHCSLENNRATVGGGVGAVLSQVQLRHCRLSGNHAGNLSDSEGVGGAVAGLLEANVLLDGCTLVNNVAAPGGAGGGVFIGSGILGVRDCAFTLNRAGGAGTGGGICIGSTGGALVMQSTLDHNQAGFGAALFAQTSGRVLLENMTVAQNELNPAAPGPDAGGGVRLNDGRLTVLNSIFWFNEGQQIAAASGTDLLVAYSNIQGGFPGPGNIADDPLFARLDSAGLSDYHLRSRYGRFNTTTQKWVRDPNDLSPCINAGDPNAPVDLEPSPHGDRVNMGAYGGSVQASKSKGVRFIHVDKSFGQANQDGSSRGKAITSIQQAIQRAEDGDTVLVWPGRYVESLFLLGKAITVQSAADAALLESPGNDGVAVTFQAAEGPNTVLKNLVIHNNAVYGLLCNNSSPTLDHITVVNNDTGILVAGDSHPLIQNSIFWHNDRADLVNFSETTVRFSCLEKGPLDGVGNISQDPLFVDPNSTDPNSDFHLQSQRGRFLPSSADPYQATGVGPNLIQDTQTSSCIDAGDPKVPPLAERLPNGGRVNMGAYGATPYASLSDWPVAGDLNRDGRVNYVDFQSVVTLEELLEVADAWLMKLEWTDWIF